MKIDRTSGLSQKISVLSFWAMVSVVIIHSKALSGEPSSWNVFLQWLCTRGLSKWAVPFFFAASGFWFSKALVAGRPTMEIYAKKICSLLLPYLLWAVIGTILCLPLICFNNYVTHRMLFERTVFGHSTFWGCINDMFGITVHAPGGNAVLWYVRALLVFFIFTPIWRLLRTYVPRCLFVSAVILAMVPGHKIPMLAINTNWLGWILIGVSVERFSLERATGNLMAILILGVGALCLSVLEAACQAGWVFDGGWREWTQSLIPCFGVPFAWLVYDLLSTKAMRTLPIWMKINFWNYCIHAIFTSYFMACIFYLFGKSNGVLLMTMLLTPCVGLALSMFSGLVVRKLFPRSFAILVGGRIG